MTTKLEQMPFAWDSTTYAMSVVKSEPSFESGGDSIDSMVTVSLVRGMNSDQALGDRIYKNSLENASDAAIKQEIQNFDWEFAFPSTSSQSRDKDMLLDKPVLVQHREERPAKRIKIEPDTAAGLLPSLCRPEKHKQESTELKHRSTNLGIHTPMLTSDSLANLKENMVTSDINDMTIGEEDRKVYILDDRHMLPNLPDSAGSNEEILHENSDCTQSNNSSSTSRLKRQSQNAKKKYTCSLCEYSSRQHSAFLGHMRRHTGEKPYRCTVCEYRCSEKRDIGSHMRIHTGQKPYKCSICEYRTAQRGSLQTHMQVHTGEKSFQCSLCDFRCGNRSYLQDHMRRHTGEKPYMCSLCDYRSATKAGLRAHMKKHTDKKPYACSFCEYRCFIKHHLVVHIRTHAGEKPYKCSFCEYRCTLKHHLSEHIRTHTGEKPYKCSFCDYRSATNSNVLKHTRRHTKEKP